MTKNQPAKAKEQSANQKAYCFPELGITVYASSLAEATEQVESQ